MHGCPSWSKGPDSSSGSENCVGSNPTPCKIYKIVLNTLIYILQIFNWFKKLLYIFLYKMSHQYVWLSIDPINKKINYYPKLIAEKIEKAYLEIVENIEGEKKTSPVEKPKEIKGISYS